MKGECGITVVIRIGNIYVIIMIFIKIPWPGAEDTVLSVKYLLHKPEALSSAP